eukprot:4741548-Amphidinium_carterae.1
MYIFVHFGWHYIDESSHELHNLRKPLRGCTPGERPPSDAGGELIPYVQKQLRGNASRGWHCIDEHSHAVRHFHKPL